MRLFGGIPNIRKMIARAAFALGVIFCAAMVATPAAAQLLVTTAIPAPYSPTPDPGETTALTITLSNQDTNNVTGAHFDLDLQRETNSGFTIVDAGLGNGGIKSFTCKLGDSAQTPTTAIGTLTATPGDHTIHFSGGQVPKFEISGRAGQCDITVLIVSTKAGGNDVIVRANDVSGTSGSTPVSNGGDAPQTYQVASFAAPTFTKAFQDHSIPLGGTTDVTLTIKNNSSAITLPLNSSPYGLRDTLQGGLQVGSAAPTVSAGCGGATTAGGAGSSTFDIVGGVIATGATCTVTFQVKSTAIGSGIVNQIDPASDFKTIRGVFTGAVSDSITVTSALVVTSKFGAGDGDPLPNNQTSTFTVYFNNLGAATLNQGSNVFHGIPGRFDIADAVARGGTGEGLVIQGTPTTTNCGGAAAHLTVSTDGKEYDLTGAVFPPGTADDGQACRLNFTYKGVLITGGDQTQQTFTDFIKANDVVTNEGVKNGATTTSAITVVNSLQGDKYLVTPHGDVGQNGTPPQIGGGQIVQYKMVIANYSPADKLVVTDKLPTGMKALNTTTYPFQHTGDTTACDTVTMDVTDDAVPVFVYPSFPAPTGGTAMRCVITFYVQWPATAADSAPLTNTLDACDYRYGPTADSRGVVRGAQTGACALRGTGAPGVFVAPLTITEAFSAASPVNAGTPVTLTYTLTNLSGYTVNAVTFHDVLPAGMTVVSPPTASQCGGTVGTSTDTHGATVIDFTNGTLQARADSGFGSLTGVNQCTVVVTVTGTPATYNNDIPAQTLEGDQAQGSAIFHVKSSQAPTTASVTFLGQLTTSKSFAPQAVANGGQSRVTITLKNDSNQTYNNIKVIDPLTGTNLVLPATTAAVDAQTTCATGAHITAPAGGATAQIDSVTLPAGGQCTFSFNVLTSANPPSGWTNTIPPGNVTADGGVTNITAISASLGNAANQNIVIGVTPSRSGLSAPGQISTLTVSIKAPPGTTLTNVSLTDYLTVGGTPGGADQGLIFASPANPLTNCADGTPSVATDGKSFSLTGATIPANTTCTFQADVTLLQLGNKTNFIPAGQVHNDQNLTNTAAQANIGLTGTIGVVKQFAPNLVKPNVRSRLTITLYNLIQTEAVDNIQFIDNLPVSPVGLTVASPANTSTTCKDVNGAAITPSVSATSIGVSGVHLDKNDAANPKTCTVSVDVVSPNEAAFTNTIPQFAVQGVGHDSGTVAQNQVAADATLQVRTPVTIGKSFLPTTVTPGQESTATITITNPNSTALTNAFLVDTLPSGLFLSTSPNAATTCGPNPPTAVASGTQVRLINGTIPSGPAGSCTITFKVVSNISASYTNSIAVSSLTTLIGVTNENPAQAVLIVKEPPSVDKSFSPPSIPVNGTSTLTIRLNNNNSATLGDATLSSAFTDTLPISPGATTVAVGSIGGTCPNVATNTTATVGSGSVIYASGAKIPPGGCTITVPVTASIVGGPYTNIIPSNTLLTDFGSNVQPATALLVVSPLGFITGRVFRDNDVAADGVYQDGTDAPIPNVNITLTGSSFGPDNISGTPDDVASITPITVQTNALGEYAFTQLNAGTYTITQAAQPAGTLNGTATAGVFATGTGTPGVASNPTATSSVITGIVLNFNAGPATVAGSVDNNFAEIAGGTLSGFVYNDANNDGVKQGGESGIAGVTIEVHQGATAGGTLVATQVTDGTGAYSFSGLTVGTYTIVEVGQPSGTADGKTTPGSGGGAATLPGSLPSAISNIAVGVNTTSTNNNFGEVTAGSISGRIFKDVNNNGSFDAGADTGLNGIVVNLYAGAAASGPTFATTSTDLNGDYSFGGLGAGTYSVGEPTQPASTTDGKTTAGTAGGTATAQGTIPSSITSIGLGAGIASTGNNFAEITSAAPPATTSISGKVYGDANDNGVVDSGETGISGVTVKLTGTDSAGNAVNKTATTDANGDYAFTDLQPSDATGYTITETQPANSDGKTTAPTGTANAAKPIAAGGSDAIIGVVFGATPLSGYNFGEKAGATISGKVYKDLNDNGVADAGEDGISGVTVTLTGTSAAGVAVSLTTTSNAFGAYSFAAPPSNGAGYTITETQPAFGDGKTTAPGVGSATSSKPVATGQPDIITGVIFGTNPLAGYNFGELDQTTKITGYVFGDTNNNGVKDAGEQGIAGVTVTLTGTSGAGAAVSMTTTTAADGTFTFTGVPPSGATGYTVTEVQPSGYTDGKTIVTAGQPGTPNSGKAVNVGDQDRVGGVVVAANTNRGDYIFGEVPIPGLKPPIVNGYVYLDRRHTRQRPTDGSVEGQGGWTVVLRQGAQVICTTTTNEKGFYQFDNLHCPGYEQSGLPTGPGFSITFTKDGSSLPAVPTSGGDRGQVPPNGGQILNITLNPSDQVVEQNLPLDPAGVIYNSLTRATVPGAVITITGPAGFDPLTHLVGGTAAQTQTTGADGLYQFLLQNGYPTGTYTLTVTAPANFQPGVSTTIPVCAGALTVTLVPNPALVQAFDNPPPTSAPNTCVGLQAGGANSTQYYLQFNITNGGSADILNNHIPLDPTLTGALFITKTSPMVNVARGDLVPYTITATNTETRASGTVTIRDQLPAGFKYRDGTATKNGVKAAPTIENGFVTWPAETFAPKQKNTYTLMLTVGAGVSDGDYVNRAWGAVPGGGGGAATNIASATVRIVPDPTFDCPDIIGKVFDDKNANGFQDDGEPGIPAVRVATANGLLITSDAEGRFHIPCPMTPDQDRGSNFVLKLDARSLPSGFRLTTENPASIRVTRGKMVKLNFGATIHRVVRVELSDAAFEPGTANLKAEFRAGIDTMPAALAERPSVVRLAYRTGSDGADLVKKRIEAVRAQIRSGWTASRGRYPLDVEVEGGQP
jgi:uncharacterized repeat protein (TIGR01451 family)